MKNKICVEPLIKLKDFGLEPFELISEKLLKDRAVCQRIDRCELPKHKQLQED